MMGCARLQIGLRSLCLSACLALVGAAVHPGVLFATPAPIRTGIWVTQKLPSDAAALTEFDSSLSAARDLNGVSLHIPWDQIERGAGKPDFGFLDQTIAVLRKKKVDYQLCLMPGAFTPGFIYAEGAQAFETQVQNPHRPNFGATIRIPVPWDPVFERDFAGIIEELGRRYAEDPLCVGVVLTCANFMSAEMHLPKSRADLAHWSSFGDYESRLFEVYKKFTDIWADAFPRQEICLHLSKVLRLPAGFCEQIVNYGLSKYPRRFSIQSCQLTGRKEDTGVMTYDLIQRYRDRALHGFQSLAALNGSDGRMGSAEMAALNIVHAQGQYWELWHGDGFDPEKAGKAAQALREANRLGYDLYKKKLISEGEYR